MSNRPKGVWVISAILLVGTSIAAITGVSLLWPGTFLDGIWVLNSQAYLEFAALGRVSGFVLLVLGAVTAFAALGLLQVRKWGWWLVVSLFTINAVGDVIRIVAGTSLKGLVGVFIVTGLLFYLTRSGVRSFFGIISKQTSTLPSDLSAERKSS